MPRSGDHARSARRVWQRVDSACGFAPVLASLTDNGTLQIINVRILNFMSHFGSSLVLLAGALLLSGCNKGPENSSASANGPMKIRVGYIGLTCEAPIYTAVEKGFFKEENLDVTLVKCDWANYKDVLALGGFDVTHHLIMYFLKPIEQGLDVKFTGGIHRGCLRVQASAHGNIRSIEDLRGKRIGVPGMGTPPFIFANRVWARMASTPAKTSLGSFSP